MYILLALTIMMFVLLIGAAILFLVKPKFLSKYTGMEFDEDGEIKNRESNKTESINTSNPMDGQMIGDSKDFIPLPDKNGFIDGYLNLGYHNYRAIIEVSSLNYFLMSEHGQDVVELSYRKFLNTLTFPISIYTQTQEFDVATMMQALKQNVKEAEKLFPGASDYMNEYVANMEFLTDYIGNEKIKKKYIIVWFSGGELKDLSALNATEIREYALSVLSNRCAVVINGLAKIGLTAKVLDNVGAAECIYAYIHRTVFKIVDEIINGTFDSLAINYDKSAEIDKDKLIKLILEETQNSIDVQLRASNCSKEQDSVYSYITSVLEYFKNRVDSAEGMAELYELAEKVIKQQKEAEHV